MAHSSEEIGKSDCWEIEGVELVGENRRINGCWLKVNNEDWKETVEENRGYCPILLQQPSRFFYWLKPVTSAKSQSS